MDDGTPQKYFQFPLCCLCFGEVDHRVDAIVSFCMGTVGSSAWSKLSEDQQNGVAADITSSEKLPTDFDEEDADHFAFMYGSKILNVSFGSIDGCIRQQKELTEHICGWQRRYGRDADVRIRADILWDAHAGRLPYREFSVICAVYSVIGNNKGPVRVTRDMIINRALGYKSAHCIAQREDGITPLTVKEVRGSLDKLEARGFFCRVHPSPRKTYFSNRMTHEQLAAAVVALEAKRVAAKSKTLFTQASLQQAIQKRAQEIILCPTK